MTFNWKSLLAFAGRRRVVLNLLTFRMLNRGKKREPWTLELTQWHIFICCSRPQDIGNWLSTDTTLKDNRAACDCRLILRSTDEEGPYCVVWRGRQKTTDDTKQQTEEKKKYLKLKFLLPSERASIYCCCRRLNSPWTFNSAGSDSRVATIFCAIHW